MEIQNNTQVEKIEANLEPLPKGTCPECQRKMIQRRDKFICFTCKLDIWNLKLFKVQIELECDWVGTSVEDVRKQIDEEYGGFEDIKNNISIEEIK